MKPGHPGHRGCSPNGARYDGRVPGLALAVRQKSRVDVGRGAAAWRYAVPFRGMAGYDDDLRFAHVLADAADDITIRRFRALDLTDAELPARTANL